LKRREEERQEAATKINRWRECSLCVVSSSRTVMLQLRFKHGGG
jgi:hypothetical protein